MISFAYFALLSRVGVKSHGERFSFRDPLGFNHVYNVYAAYLFVLLNIDSVYLSVQEIPAD
jgi:hypothetical protein